MIGPMSLPGLKGQKILVTGGLGFVGSNIAARCVRLGAEVTIYDCLDPKSGGNRHNIHEIRGDVRIELNDVRNFEGISAAVLNKDVVFNCAAYTSHPNSMSDPLMDIEINCKGTINLLEAARRFHPDTKIVHIGTSTQIGRMVRPEADELHPEFPVDIYSANKSASEKYVLIYGNAYKMRTTVVRLANNYGPRSCIKSADFGFMNYFIGLALQGREIPIFGDGKQLRNISFIEDSVSAMILASRSEAANGEVFFAVSDDQISVAKLSAQIAAHIGGKVRFVEWPKNREAIEIGDAVIQNQKVKKILGWSPQHGLAQGLAMTKEYYAPILEKYL